MSILRWVVQATCKDTDLDVNTGRNHRMAIVEFYVPIPGDMNGYGMSTGGAILTDARFEKYSAYRALRGDQLKLLDSGKMVKVTRAIVIDELTVEQIRKRLHEEWRALCTLIPQELRSRYELAGLCEWEDE